MWDKRLVKRVVIALPTSAWYLPRQRYMLGLDVEKMSYPKQRSRQLYFQLAVLKTNLGMQCEKAHFYFHLLSILLQTKILSMTIFDFFIETNQWLAGIIFQRFLLNTFVKIRVEVPGNFQLNCILRSCLQFFNLLPGKRHIQFHEVSSVYFKGSFVCI